MFNTIEAVNISDSGNSVTNPGHQSARPFTLFPKLSTEIRLMIWHATFPRNRVVNLYDCGRVPSPTGQYPSGIEPLLSAPIMLYVNHENR
jgi:hypothetical protein